MTMFDSGQVTRRELLRTGAALTGGAVAAGLLRGTPLRAAASWLHEQQAGGQAAPSDPLSRMRAQLGAVPIEAVKLADNLTMLSGPGGNLAVLYGPDGKVVVDTFVLTAWGGLKERLDGLGPAPVKVVIDTHWHFDHTDNNPGFREAGAVILAHANTTKRLSETHELLGIRFEPAPPSARPTQTFTSAHKLQANGEAVELGYIPPAHTDTDIRIRFTRANVLHLGDTCFSGTYPFIDAGTGGSIDGMIRAADRSLRMLDGSTRVIPGHGPVMDRGGLTEYRDMMVTVRDRVQKLKAAGRTVEEAVAAKPTADLDATWGKGFLQPDMFVTIVYNTL